MRLIARRLRRPLSRPCRCSLSTLLDLSRAPPSFDPKDVVVLPDVISTEGHDAIVIEANGWVSRRPWETDHWDAVIIGYREVERSLERWAPATSSVLTGLQRLVDPEKEFLPPHIIDLREDGRIDPHVDSIKFSGGIVSGLSLMSTRVMVLRNDGEEEQQLAERGEEAGAAGVGEVRLLLPPRSLYVLRGGARYNMTHEISGEDQEWEGIGLIAPSRRVSVMFRDALPAAKQPAPPEMIADVLAAG